MSDRSWKRVVLGIGNPGAEYAETRHNVGFLVLDRAAAALGLRFCRLDRDQLALGGRVKAQIAEGHTGQITLAGLAGLPGVIGPGASSSGESFLLVKPMTYVNCSGDVAAPLLRVAGRSPESLFVVVDDLNLPLGRIRVRPSGSSGGHNGLKSIEAALCTPDYPRLRLGIGAPRDATPVDHVLAAFLPEEREVLDASLDRARDAVLAWLAGSSVQDLTDRFNGPGTRDS